MSRNVLWIVAAFVGLLGVVWFAAWVFGEGDRTRQIAIFGVGLGAAGALKHLHDIWEKVQERKKNDEEKQERVQATVEFKPYDTGTPHLGVVLFNEGSRPVTIKRVMMVIKTDAGEKTDQYVMATEPVTRYSMNGQPMLVPNYLEQVKLEPGTPAEFFTHGPKDFKSQALVKLPPEAFEIVVESYKGVVARVEGAAILEAIKGRPKPPRLQIGVGEPTRLPEF